MTLSTFPHAGWSCVCVFFGETSVQALCPLLSWVVFLELSRSSHSLGTGPPSISPLARILSPQQLLPALQAGGCPRVLAGIPGVAGTMAVPSHPSRVVIDASAGRHLSIADWQSLVVLLKVTCQDLYCVK